MKSKRKKKKKNFFLKKKKKNKPKKIFKRLCVYSGPAEAGREYQIRNWSSRQL